MDPLQIETDEPLEVTNLVHPSNDFDAPKGNSCSTSQILVSSFKLKEEEITDPLQIKKDEPLKISNFSHSSYGLDTPKSSSCNSIQDLVGSFTLKEEFVDSLQIENDEPMKVSNLSHLSYGLDTPKSSSCNSSQALVGSFILMEEGSLRNWRSQKKCDGLVNDFSSTGELIWWSNVSNNSKLNEKIYLKTAVEIQKLTKRTIEENCCGKWRCSACGKIENSFYFLQLHKSTNCETGSAFICEICRKEINNYSEFAIHYIGHEAGKKKECPICLCPNVNDIKEHVIMERHLSEDITGFKFTTNECKKSNEKAKPEVCFSSTIDGYSQDTIADILPLVKMQNMDVSSASVDVNAAKMSPVSNELVLGNQEQVDQGKPDHRLRKNNAVYYEFSDSDINEIGEEEPIHSFSSSPSSSKKILVCKVCGDKASGLHYGVSTCEACKRFFRRSILRQTEYTVADCLREGKCLVSWVNKSECQFCRFKKCLVVGMSRNYCKVDSLSKTSEKKSKKESIVQSTLDVQEKSNLRKRKENTLYVESSNSDIDGISDEEAHQYKGNGTFKCRVCKVAYSDQDRLKYHETTVYHIQKVGKNNEPDEYNGKDTLLTTIPTKQSPENIYICRICNESFSLRLLLLNHIKAHDRIEIQQCQFYCSLKKKFPLHRRFVTQRKTKNKFECDTCNKSYPYRTSLLRHKRRHAKDRQNLCYICGLSLNCPKSLELHVQRHTGEKSFLCDRCGMQFRLRDSLNDHMKMHLRKESGQTPGKLFECEICNKTLETRRGYTSHVKRHTQPKIHGCTFCQRSFYTRFMLIEHIRTHTGEKPYECQTCGHTCAHYASLYSHMKRHSIERPHRCELCNITFKNRKTRDDHLNTHTGARPYKCKQCDKTFGIYGAFRVHKKSHTGKRFREKKYGCSICSEVFAVSAYRDQHVALHANPNPFNCEFCTKSFNFKKNMVEHVQRVHPDRNPFKCKLCGKTYDSIKKIRIHITSRACQTKEKLSKTMKIQSESIEGDGKMNVEKTANLFVCNICEEDFMSTEDILSHFNSFHTHFK